MVSHATTVEVTPEQVQSAPQQTNGWLIETRTGKRSILRACLDNWQSGLTVALVSVPLSISLGIASVAGDDPAAPAMGVATAIWGGLTAGIFGSSDLNIVGPAGALSGMLNSYTIKYNGAGILPYISIISAFFVAACYLLNLQRFLLMMPKAVFEGFTLAVAIIIGMNQMNMAFDLHPRGPKHEHFYENIIESFKVLDQANAAPSIFFVVDTLLLLGLVKYVPKIKNVGIPWTVVIPLLTIPMGYLAETGNLGGIELPTLKTKFGILEPRIVEPPSKPLSHYANGDMAGVVFSSFGVAFVAVLETLISAKIAEQRTDWPFNEARETLGLMVSHVVCGVLGAMPPTGVFVRTSLNVQLGATHRLSQIINSIFVLLIAVVAMPVFSYLPQASVAGLLVFASVRMAPITYIISLWRTDKCSCALLLFTALACVFRDPVEGLIVGMIIALLRDAAGTAYGHAQVYGLPSTGKNASTHPFGIHTKPESSATQLTEDFEKSSELVQSGSPITVLLKRLQGTARPAVIAADAIGDSVAGKVVLYEPMGALVFLNADRHTARLQTLRRLKPATLIVSLEKITRADVDGTSALGKAVQQCQKAEIVTEIFIPSKLSPYFAQAAWIHELEGLGKVHWSDTASALPEDTKTEVKKGCEEKSEEKNEAVHAICVEDYDGSCENIYAAPKGEVYGPQGVTKEDREEAVCIGVDADASEAAAQK